MRACLAFLAFPVCLGAQAIDPRHAGPIDSGKTRWLTGKGFDQALQWGETGELIISHIEGSQFFDVVSTTCEGTGIFRLAGDGHVIPLTTGHPVCDALNRLFPNEIGVDPDGRSMIYSVRGEKGERLVRLDFATKRIDTLSTECPSGLANPLCARRYGGDGHPSMSPDGARIAYSINDRITIKDTSGTSFGVIARGNYPAWSRDGRWIAYLAYDRSAANTSAIHVVRPDGSGDRVVFVNRVHTTYESGWGPLREGTAWVPLVWSPDGSALAFSRVYGNGTPIWRVDIATRALRAITAPGR